MKNKSWINLLDKFCLNFFYKKKSFFNFTHKKYINLLNFIFLISTEIIEIPLNYNVLEKIYLSLLSIIIILCLLLSVAYAILLERKILASIQRRRGPNYVGFLGLLQPIADAVKLILKETIIPSAADKIIFILSPLIALTLSLVNWAIIPFFKNGNFADINISILMFFAISSLTVYGIIMSGWSSNSKYAFLGALRAAAQVIAYEVCIGLTLVYILIQTQSLNYNDIIMQQIVMYNAITCFIFFILFFIACLAETNRPPFDLPEAEAELVSGYNVEYSAMTFGYFFLSEYVSIWTVCSLNVIIFLGGHIFMKISSLFFFVWKTIILVGVFIWVRASVPRYRYDQLMRLGWKILLPITLGCLIFFISIYYYLLKKSNYLMSVDEILIYVWTWIKKKICYYLNIDIVDKDKIEVKQTEIKEEELFNFNLYENNSILIDLIDLIDLKDNWKKENLNEEEIDIFKASFTKEGQFLNENCPSTPSKQELNLLFVFLFKNIKNLKKEQNKNLINKDMNNINTNFDNFYEHFITLSTSFYKNKKYNILKNYLYLNNNLNYYLNINNLFITTFNKNLSKIRINLLLIQEMILNNDNILTIKMKKLFIITKFKNINLFKDINLISLNKFIKLSLEINFVFILSILFLKQLNLCNNIRNFLYYLFKKIKLKIKIFILENLKWKKNRFIMKKNIQIIKKIYIKNKKKFDNFFKYLFFIYKWQQILFIELKKFWFFFKEILIFLELRGIYDQNFNIYDINLIYTEIIHIKKQILMQMKIINIDKNDIDLLDNIKYLIFLRENLKKIFSKNLKKIKNKNFIIWQKKDLFYYIYVKILDLKKQIKSNFIILLKNYIIFYKQIKNAYLSKKNVYAFFLSKKKEKKNIYLNEFNILKEEKEEKEEKKRKEKIKEKKKIKKEEIVTWLKEIKQKKTKKKRKKRITKREKEEQRRKEEEEKRIKKYARKKAHEDRRKRIWQEKNTKFFWKIKKYKWYWEKQKIDGKIIKTRKRRKKKIFKKWKYYAWKENLENFIKRKKKEEMNKKFIEKEKNWQWIDWKEIKEKKKKEKWKKSKYKLQYYWEKKKKKKVKKRKIKIKMKLSNIFQFESNKYLKERTQWFIREKSEKVKAFDLMIDAYRQINLPYYYNEEKEWRNYLEIFENFFNKLRRNLTLKYKWYWDYHLRLKIWRIWDWEYYRRLILKIFKVWHNKWINWNFEDWKKWEYKNHILFKMLINTWQNDRTIILFDLEQIIDVRSEGQYFMYVWEDVLVIELEKMAKKMFKMLYNNKKKKRSGLEIRNMFILKTFKEKKK